MNLIALSSRFFQTRCIIAGSPRTCGSGPTFTSMVRPVIAGARSLRVARTSAVMSIADADISRRPMREKARMSSINRAIFSAPSRTTWMRRCALRVQLVAIVFLQHVGKTVDRPQRRAQIVRYRDRQTTPVHDWPNQAPGWLSPDRLCVRRQVPQDAAGAAPVPLPSAFAAVISRAAANTPRTSPFSSR